MLPSEVTWSLIILTAILDAILKMAISYFRDIWDVNLLHPYQILLSTSGPNNVEKSMLLSSSEQFRAFG